MGPRTASWSGVVLLLGLWGGGAGAEDFGPPVPGTERLTMTGDIASDLVAGVDRFVLKQIEESTAKRAHHWRRDFSSPAAFEASIAPNRARLAHILGVREKREPATRIRYLVDQSAARQGPARQGLNEVDSVRAVSWPAFGDVTG